MRIVAAPPCVVLAVVLAACGSLTTPPAASPGIRIEYLAQPPAGRSATADDLESIRGIIANRLDATGLAWVRVSRLDPDRIVVELPAVESPDAIRALAGATGRLDFVPLGTTPMQRGEQIDLELFPPLFSGDEVARASIGADQTGQRTLDFDLADEGRRAFAAWTSNHVGEYFAIVLDGTVVSAPVINEPIPGGQVQISQGEVGGFPLAEARDIVTLVRFGALPFPVREVAFSR